jgi:hypothetical protein
MSPARRLDGVDFSECGFNSSACRESKNSVWTREVADGDVFASVKAVRHLRGHAFLLASGAVAVAGE